MNTASSPEPERFFVQKLTPRQFLTGRFGTGVLTLLVLGGLAWVLPGVRGSVTAPAAPPPRLLPVEAVRPEPVTHYALEQQYTGLTRAARSSALAFERPGLVTAVLVDEGSTVRRGQKIAELDVRVLERQRDELKAERAVARAVLDELEAGPREEDIAAARAQRAAVAADLGLAKARAARVKRLLNNETTSDEEWDAARFQVTALEARLAAAAAALLELERGTRAEQLVAQRARLASVDARLATLEEQIADGILLAPYDAVVVERHLDEGAVVAAGAHVVSLVDNGAREARIGVPADVAAGLSIGDAASLHVDGRKLTATVTGIPPLTEAATRTRPIILTLDAAVTPQPAPGAVARWTLARRVEARGYWLDAGALRRSVRGLWSCYVVVGDGGPEGNVVEQRPVEVLHADGARVLVRGTLGARDRVLADGAHRVVAGQRVLVQGS